MKKELAFLRRYIGTLIGRHHAVLALVVAMLLLVALAVLFL